VEQPSQIPLFDTPSSREQAVEDAINELSIGTDEGDRGAVFTKRAVVDAILDLSGYRVDQPLAQLRLLEPSFGEGDFLLPAVERLLASYERNGGSWTSAADELSNCIRAVEIHGPTYRQTKDTLQSRLLAWGMSHSSAKALAEAWLVQDDFLLTNIEGAFHVIAGNPPYVRQERIPTPLMVVYRKRYKTIYDRADLYVPFFERCLDLLAEGGRLGFICANRWLKNKYGGPLRAKVALGYDLLYFIDMENVDAFHSDVIAYPAITVMTRRALSEGAPPTRVALKPNPGAESMARLASALLNGGQDSDARITEVRGVANGRDPWLLDMPNQLRLLRRLEAEFPSLEQAGCKVGIGVATGADRIFIRTYTELPVEEGRKLPLVMAPDLVDGRIQWGGQGVLNPFLEDGTLAPLECFPRFAAFLQEHREAISGRYVARKNPNRWYRTIDRIDSSLRTRPKLLIPDIKGTATVVHDCGEFYPHHNLYYVVSDTWNLRALQTVLRSSVSVMFVAAYCVRMAGGFLRFQAQYLRRIRIPQWENVSAEMREELIAASEAREQRALDEPVFRLFGLDEHEGALASTIADGAQVRPVSRAK